ncbi:hypothetical protein [Kitasatospora sp. NPDC101183]|uniref:hypothetical protein n=1 Tax=Kitasatospora sp. NPDC101183 TaxID=3364100 RepID=UPI003819BDB6
MPEVEVNGQEFSYNEDRTGSRKLQISANGVPNSQHLYKFRPDPHKQKDYNKNQAAFYRDMARHAAGLFTNGSGGPKWKETGEFNWHGVEYSLEAY